MRVLSDYVQLQRLEPGALHALLFDKHPPDKDRYLRTDLPVVRAPMMWSSPTAALGLSLLPYDWLKDGLPV